MAWRTSSHYLECLVVFYYSTWDSAGETLWLNKRWILSICPFLCPVSELSCPGISNDINNGFRENLLLYPEGNFVYICDIITISYSHSLSVIACSSLGSQVAGVYPGASGDSPWVGSPLLLGINSSVIHVLPLRRWQYDFRGVNKEVLVRGALKSAVWWSEGSLKAHWLTWTMLTEVSPAL